MKSNENIAISLLFVFTSALFIVNTAQARSVQYVVTGPVTAWETHGFGIEVIDKHEIVATENKGKLYEFKQIWDAVDEYNESKGKCTLCVKYKCGRESSPISWGINALKQPNLMEETKDGYRRVDADYVTFPCIKR